MSEATLSSTATPDIRDQLFAQLAELSRLNNAFNVKVEYKDRVAVGPVLILGVRDATLDHLRDSEGWLEPLIGGSGEGSFTLQIWHASYKEGGVPIGRFSTRVSGMPRYRPQSRVISVNWDVLDDPSYGGPRDITHPKKPEAPAGATAKGPQSAYDASIASGGNGSGGNTTTVIAQPPGGAAVSETERILRKEKEVSERESAIQMTALKLDMDRKEKESASRLDKLERLLERVIERAAQPATVTGPSFTDLMQMQERQRAEERERETKREDARQAREAEERRLERERQDRREREEKEREDRRERDAREARQKELEMQRELARIAAEAAKEQATLQREMLTRKDSAGEAVAKMMESMSRVQQQSSDMQASMIGSMTKLALEVTEAMRPESEPSWIQGLRVGFEGLKGMGGGAAAAGAQAFKGLNPAADAGAGGAAGAGASAGAGAGGQPPGETGAEEESDLPELPKSVAALEKLIPAMAPPAQVAKVVVSAAMTDKEFQALAYGEYKGNVIQLFDDYFGAWVDENKAQREPYARAILEAIQAEVVRANDAKAEEERLSIAKKARAAAARNSGEAPAPAAVPGSEGGTFTGEDAAKTAEQPAAAPAAAPRKKRGG